MRVEDLQVTMERVEDLVPYARNAKKHTEEQVRQIANSIRKFGFADPVGIWCNADGEHEIVEGHGRVLAAQKLGMDEVPVICLDALTDEERRAYMLAHNQLTMNTGWDWSVLGSEIESVCSEFDFEDIGFSRFDILTAEELAGYGDEEAEYADYNGIAASNLERSNVTLIFSGREEEEWVRSILGISEGANIKRIYRVSALL